MIGVEVGSEGESSVIFSAEQLRPETISAFEALVQFAEKNFPAEGRLKHIHLCTFGEVDRLVVGGGTSVYGDLLIAKPGVWSHWHRYFTYFATADDARINSVDDLAKYLLDPKADFKREERFYSAAREIVDF